MTARPGACWQVSILVAPAVGDAFCALVDRHVDVVSAFETESGGLWSVQGFTTVEPDRARLSAEIAVLAASEGVAAPELEIADLTGIDWLGANRASFPALVYGRVRVRGSHLSRTSAGSGIDVLIDAARAFGSGSHATTEGCLRALQDIARRRRPRRMLDMGTGSGILAIAAAKLWRGLPVLAVDIDEVSARTAAENARLNGVGPWVRSIVGHSYDQRTIRHAGPFDLIVSNILAEPLTRLAVGLGRRLAPGGIVVLSGLLVRQEGRVLAAHRRQGLTLIGRRRIREWSTLVLQRKKK